ncbi:peptidylprolyl isomerase [Leptolyngbya sp. FACHB-261]|uniref:peptidylprolyl isomerase n=1 Tax=Leptolyngbya sp. FACHB-261 TaxID=2692806 RepID=UPI0016873550|nr:peptidylprolyl isomerase [Leptolyngbya sp. FACHB-261]MBD2100807.1 peptidylprolyl isomerase [Leptolyngbya sp. FACHB-261]
MTTHSAQADSTAVCQLNDDAIAPETLLLLWVKHQMLSQLRREVLIDQAIAPIACTPEEIASACQQFYGHKQLASEVEQRAWLDRHSLNSEQLQDLATRQLRIEKFKRVTWGHTLESYFLKRKDQFDRAIYSLIRSQNWNISQELYFRIQAGEQMFAELAQEFSQGPEAQTGGFVGPVDLVSLHPTLARVLATSQPGQLWSPMRLGEWIVVRLERMLSASLDDSMRQQLLNELFESWLQEKIVAA